MYIGSCLKQLYIFSFTDEKKGWFVFVYRLIYCADVLDMFFFFWNIK